MTSSLVLQLMVKSSATKQPAIKTRHDSMLTNLKFLKVSIGGTLCDWLIENQRENDDDTFRAINRSRYYLFQFNKL